MSLPQQTLRSLTFAAVLGTTGIALSACVADFVAPLSVASHRYPSVKKAVAATPSPRKQQMVDDETGTIDRLPTAREIFDLHPKGSDPEKMRQPFILNPHEGPLRISTLSRDDAATPDAVRARSYEPGVRSAVTKPLVPATPSMQSATANPPVTALGRQ